MYPHVSISKQPGEESTASRDALTRVRAGGEAKMGLNEIWVNLFEAARCRASRTCMRVCVFLRTRTRLSQWTIVCVRVCVLRRFFFSQFTATGC